MRPAKTQQPRPRNSVIPCRGPFAQGRTSRRHVTRQGQRRASRNRWPSAERTRCKTPNLSRFARPSIGRWVRKVRGRPIGRFQVQVCRRPLLINSPSFQFLIKLERTLRAPPDFRLNFAADNRATLSSTQCDLPQHGKIFQQGPQEDCSTFVQPTFHSTKCSYL